MSKQRKAASRELRRKLAKTNKFLVISALADSDMLAFDHVLAKDKNRAAEFIMRQRGVGMLSVEVFDHDELVKLASHLQTRHLTKIQQDMRQLTGANSNGGQRVSISRNSQPVQREVLESVSAGASEGLLAGGSGGPSSPGSETAEPGVVQPVQETGGDVGFLESIGPGGRGLGLLIKGGS